MGQGHYVGIYVGMTDKHPAFEAVTTERKKWAGDSIAYKFGPDLSSAYESKVRWLGALVVVNAGVADEPSEEFKYTAMVLTPKAIRRRYAAQVAKAQKQWDAFREKCLVNGGPDVGRGKLLLVADYD